MLTITLTNAQAREVAKLDPRKTVQQIVQAHVDTWLAPLVSDALRREAAAVAESYPKANDAVRATVKRELGIVGPDAVVRSEIVEANGIRR